MKIIFIRHGESETNVINLKSCSTNKHFLTKKGRECTRKIGEKLIKEKINIIYTSPILRAMETTNIINERLNLKAIKSPLLKEYDWGTWNEKRKDKLLTKSRKYKRYSQLSLDKKFIYKFGEKEERESRKDVAKRVKKFLQKINLNNFDKTVLIVSHSGINAVIHKVLRNLSIEKYFMQEKLEHEAIQYFSLNKKGELIDYKKVIIQINL